MIAYAGSATAVAQSFVAKINEVIFFPLITLMLAVALLVFLYGCFEFVRGASNEASRTDGKNHIMWGLVGMLIMISAYTILTIAAGTFGVPADGGLGESIY